MLETFINIIIDILKKNNLYTDNIDIFRGDETLSYDRYIDVYRLEKIKDNIKSFNNNFESLGGRIYLKDDNIVSSLDINDTVFNYNDKYIYVIPSYLKDYDYINNLVKAKDNKLNSNKDMLVIASPFRANALDNNKELKYLRDITNKYLKVVIINIDKIQIYDIESNSYQIIDNI